MHTKTNLNKTAQDNLIPTVQEQKEALAEKLTALRPSVTPEACEKAARKAGITARTAWYEYLKGKIAFLHRGQALHTALLEELKGETAAA